MDPRLLVIATALAGLLVLGLLVALVRSRAARRRTDEQLAQARAETAALRDRVEAIAAERAAERASEQRSRVPGPEARDGSVREYRITSLSTETDRSAEVARAGELTRTGFAQVALGESLVRVLSLGYGVRRALSPEVRDRIRFQVRQEVRRSRRGRREELREARRRLRTEQRTEQRTGQAGPADRPGREAA